MAQAWKELLPTLSVEMKSCSETIIHDLRSDWFLSLKPKQSDALLMGEAFYSIACDYYIADYLLWPLYQHSTVIEEPFAPYFELWTHGALAIFERPGQVTVYVGSESLESIIK